MFADSASCFASIGFVEPVATDNCTPVEQYQISGLLSGASFPLGTTLQAYEAQDTFGNIGSCSFMITVDDTTVLTIACAPDTVMFTSFDSCAKLATITPPVVSGFCTDYFSQESGVQNLLFAGGTINFTFTSVPAPATGTGVLQVFTRGDLNTDEEFYLLLSENDSVIGQTLNSPECDFNYTLTSFTIPLDSINAWAADGTIDITADASPEVNTFCGLNDVYMVLTYPTSGGTPFTLENDFTGTADATAEYTVGTTILTWQAFNEFRDTVTCAMNIVVNDTVAPVLVCPSDATISTNPLGCGSIYNYIDPVGTDSCSLVGTAQVGGLGSGNLFPIGTTIETFEATDSSGLSTTCSFSVTVLDDIDPLIACPGDTIMDSEASVCGATFTYTPPIGTDNCTGEITTQISGLGSGVVFPNGSTVESYQVTDASGNTATCAFTVTVIESTPPVISCPADIVVDNDAGSCFAAVSFTEPVGTDNCPDAFTFRVSGLAPGSDFPIGETMQGYIVLDTSGLSDTCTFKITVNDTAVLGMSCPNDTVFAAAPDSCSATLAIPQPFITGVCDNYYHQTSSVSPLTVDGGTIPFTFTGALTGATGSAVLTVYTRGDIALSNENYAILGEPGGTIGFTLSGAACDAAYTLTSFEISATSINAWAADGIITLTADASVDVNTSCPNNDVFMVLTYPTAAGASYTLVNDYNATDNASDSYPVATTTVNWTLTDAFGATVSCSHTVQVTDTTAPEIICPADIVMSTAPDTCGVVVAYTPPVGVDSCTGALTSLTSGLGTGAFFAVGNHTETYGVIDASGNTASCSFNISVLDDIDPVITCPADTTIGTDVGFCSAVFSYPDATATDNCDSLTVTQTGGLGTGSVFPAGLNTESWLATDTSGNVDSCSFIITVIDDVAPEITCPSDTAIDNDAGSCFAVFSFTEPVGTDNCPGATTIRTSGLVPGASFPLGTTVQGYRVSAGGLTDTCSFNVVVNDTTTLRLTCPGDTAVANETDSCTAFITIPQAIPAGLCTDYYADTSGTFALAAPGATISISFTGAPAGATGDALLNVYARGNIDEETELYEILDEGGGSIGFTREGTSCGTGFTITSFSIPAAMVNTWAADGTIDFTADAMPGIDLSCLETELFMTISYATDSLTSFSLTNDFTGTDDASATYTVGVTPVTWTLTNAFGVSVMCSHTVTVNDTTFPVITCPADTTLGSDIATCGTTVAYAVPVGTDNCPVPVTSLTAGLGSGAFFPLGTTTEMWTVVDASGNTSVCSFVVTIVDDVPPVITCPADVSVNVDPGFCTGTVAYIPPVGTDVCGGESTVQTAGMGPGPGFPGGTTVEEYTVTDGAGNSTSCSFTITVIENIFPVITCPADIIVDNEAASCYAAVTFVEPVGTDNCPGIVTERISGLAPGAFFPLGTTIQGYRVTDAVGQTDDCEFSITVNDTSVVRITCPADTIVPSRSDTCGADVVVPRPILGGVCEDFFIQNAPIAPLTSDGGTVDFTFTGTPDMGTADAVLHIFYRGDIDTLTETYHILAETGDTLGFTLNGTSCLPTYTQTSLALDIDSVNAWAADGNITFTADASADLDISTCLFNDLFMVLTYRTDSGGSFVLVNDYTGTEDASGYYDTGISTVNWSVTDAFGTTATCSHTIEVQDTTSPVLTCPADSTVSTETAVCGATVVYTPPVGTDNCAGVLTSLTSGSGTGVFYPVGVHVETYTAIDTSGNTTVCSFTLIVIDDHPPVVVCPSDTSLGVDAGFCTANFSYSFPTATDNCGAVTVAQIGGLGSGSAFPSGVTTELFEATDAAGNTSTCSFTVTAEDLLPPGIICPTDLVVDNDAGSCYAIVGFTEPVGTDNCPGPITNRISGLAPGSSFPIGTTIQGYEVVAGGLRDTCSFSVMVNDTAVLRITCLADTTIPNDTDSCNAAVTLVQPTLGGICTDYYTDTTAVLPLTLAGGSINFTFPGTPDGATGPALLHVFTRGNLDTLTRRYDILGESGASMGFTLESTDCDAGYTQTSFEIHPDSINAWAADGSIDFTADALADVGIGCASNDAFMIIVYSSDSGSSHTLVNDFTGTDDASGTYAMGTTTVTWTLTNAFGTVVTCDHDVTIIDTTFPDIVCPVDTVLGSDTLACGQNYAYTDPIGTDNCPGVSTAQTAGLGSGAFFPQGITTETFTTTDGAGNVTSCSFTVTVLDDIDPVIVCPADTIISQDSTNCGGTLAYAVPVGTDVCGGESTVLFSGLGTGAIFPNGASTEIYVVTDGAGNTDTCSFMVTVLEDRGPAIACPNDTTIDNDAGSCFAVFTFATPVGSDNCPGPVTVQASGLTPGDAYPLGTTVQAYTVTDTNGFTDHCRFSVTVNDTSSLLVFCPADSTLASEPDTCGATVTWDQPGMNGICEDFYTTTSSVEVLGSTGGMISFTLSGTPDAATGDAILQVYVRGDIDSLPEGYHIVGESGDTLGFTLPGAACDVGYTQTSMTIPMASINAWAADGDIVLMADASADTDPSCLDNDVFFTLSYPVDSGASFTLVNDYTGTDDTTAFFSTGTTTVTWTLTDAFGSSVTCSHNITVDDLTDPIIVCPSDTILSTLPDTCGEFYSYVAPIGTDNCPGAVTAQIAGLGSGSFFPLGVTTETYEVTPSTGSAVSCSFTITVIDDVDPVITCPADVTLSTDPGVCEAIYSYPMPIANDNCVAISIALTSGLGSGSAFPAGTNVEEYTVTDTAGNTAVCTFTVTVNDSIAPEIVCPADTVVDNDPGNCTAIVTYSTPVGTDNCPGAVTTVTSGMGSGAAFPLGVTQEAYLVTDAEGYTADCRFTVTVLDTLTLSLACTADTVLNAGADSCEILVTVPQPAIDGFCSGFYTQTTAPKSLLFIGGVINFTLPGTPTGATGPGVLTVHARGDIGEVSEYYEVDDETATLLGQTLIGTECSAGYTLTSFSIPAATINAWAADGSISFSLDATTDVDNSCPNNDVFLVLSYPSDSADSVILTNDITGTDDASGFYPVGTTVVNWTVVDINGDSATCAHTVTVNDVTLPVIVCPANATISADPALCGQVYTYTAPIGTDACPGVVTIQTAGLGSGSFYPVGTTIETYLSTDAVGNEDSCSFSVTVVDDINPVIVCPADTVLSSDPALCGVVFSYVDPIGTDNCPGESTVMTGGLGSGAVFPIGVTNDEFTVTDAAGNTATCSFNITVVDDIAPEITCPPDFVVDNDSASCFAIVTYAVPVGTDNCPGSITTQTSGLLPGALFAVGTTVQAYEVVDAGGLTAQCSFTVTVNDTAILSLSCIGDTLVGTDPDTCGALIDLPQPGIEGICDNFFSQTTPVDTLAGPGGFILFDFTGVPANASGPATLHVFAVGDIGEVGETYLISGESGGALGNTLTGIDCDATYTQTSFSIPMATLNAWAANDTVTISAIASADIDVSCLDNSVYMALSFPTDSGTVFTLVNDFNGTDDATGLYPEGSLTVTWTLTNAFGVSTSCGHSVTVTDVSVPVIVCPSDTSISIDPDTCGAVYTYIAPVGTDNCPGAITALSGGIGSGGFFPVGVTTESYTVTPVSGPDTTCSFNITVMDGTPPVIAGCPTDSIINLPTDSCDLVYSYTAPTATDNCSVPTLVLDAGLPSGTVFPSGTTTVVYVATDAGGITDTCSFDVTLVETTPPVIFCPPEVTLDSDSGVCSAVFLFISPLGSDNCPGAVTVQTDGLASGEAFPVGTTLQKYIVTDANGATDSCSFNVIVNDVEAPTAVCASFTLQLDSAGLGTLTAADIDGGSFDNCGIDTMVASPTLFSCFDLGPALATLSVQDSNGLVGFCSVFVTVVDTLGITEANPDLGADVGLCIAGDSVLLDPGPGFITWSWNTGETSPFIYADTQGTFIVNVTDGNGCDGSDTIVVDDMGPVPVITEIGGVLYSTPAVTYQWNLGGAPIAGAIDSAYTPTSGGAYTVTISDSNGCIQTSLPYLIVGVQDDLLQSVVVYPNPAKQHAFVDLVLLQPGRVEVEVYNSIGIMVWKEEVVAAERTLNRKIDLKKVAAGVHYVVVRMDGKEFIRKLVVL